MNKLYLVVILFLISCTNQKKFYYANIDINKSIKNEQLKINYNKEIFYQKSLKKDTNVNKKLEQIKKGIGKYYPVKLFLYPNAKYGLIHIKQIHNSPIHAKFDDKNLIISIIIDNTIIQKFNFYNKENYKKEKNHLLFMLKTKKKSPENIYKILSKLITDYKINIGMVEGLDKNYISHIKFEKQIKEANKQIKGIIKDINNLLDRSKDKKKTYKNLKTQKKENSNNDNSFLNLIVEKKIKLVTENPKYTIKGLILIKQLMLLNNIKWTTLENKRDSINLVNKSFSNKNQDINKTIFDTLFLQREKSAVINIINYLKDNKSQEKICFIIYGKAHKFDYILSKWNKKIKHKISLLEVDTTQ